MELLEKARDKVASIQFRIEKGKCAKTEVANAKAEPPQEREKGKTAL